MWRLAANHGGGRRTEACGTVVPATSDSEAASLTGTRSGKAQVDEELSETEALVAQMRLELGLASDTTDGAEKFPDSGSG